MACSKYCRKRNIRNIQIVSVDNPAANPADPALLGYSLEKQLDLVCKAVVKQSPDEKVGVFARRNGKLAVIEYSDIDAELGNSKKEDGTLAFGLASINVFCFSLDYIKEITRQLDDPFFLPYHTALKKVDYYCPKLNRTVRPEKENTIKKERFLFDCFHTAKSFHILVTDRSEFLPIKDIETAKNAASLLQKMFHSRLHSAGSLCSQEKCTCEISPLCFIPGEDISSPRNSIIPHK